MGANLTGVAETDEEAFEAWHTAAGLATYRECWDAAIASTAGRQSRSPGRSTGLVEEALADALRMVKQYAPNGFERSARYRRCADALEAERGGLGREELARVIAVEMMLRQGYRQPSDLNGDHYERSVEMMMHNHENERLGDAILALFAHPRPSKTEEG